VKNKIILCLAFALGTMFVPNLHAQEKLADAVARIDHDRILWLANRALHLKPPAITDHVATNTSTVILVGHI
jgi:L-lysine 2,3-aminomutase